MIDNLEENAVRRVARKKILSGYRGSWGEWFYGGEEVKAMEQEWCDYFKVKHAIFVNSATSGLECALTAVGLQQNYADIKNNVSQFGRYVPPEVVVTPYSMTCSASLPLKFGAKPVFADIEKDYYCLDPKSIESKITRNTKAILIVDLFGMPYDADAINAIARKYKLMVIEDAAQAIGVKYKNRFAGTLGDIGVYSLNVHKHIQCGEGGVVVTNNDELAWKIRLAMNHGEAVENDLKSPYQNIVGGNYRNTEMSAAVVREQLKKLPGIIDKYQELAKPFNIPVRPNCTSAYYKFATPGAPKKIDKAIYNTKQHYITPLYQLPLFRSLGYPQNLCPVCEEVEKNIHVSWVKEIL